MHVYIFFFTHTYSPVCFLIFPVDVWHSQSPTLGSQLHAPPQHPRQTLSSPRYGRQIRVETREDRVDCGVWVVLSAISSLYLWLSAPVCTLCAVLMIATFYHLQDCHLQFALSLCVYTVKIIPLNYYNQN